MSTPITRIFISLLLCLLVSPQRVDECPDDPDKTRPMRCGCGVPDTDSDGDGVPDCQDVCPNDPVHQFAVGCGCGESEDDSDGDGYPDCRDLCPRDPEKFRHEGFCGCGVLENDTDGDGRPDCVDDCPNNALKTREGQCGCGEPDIDSDGDGVMDCNDECPFSPVSSAYCGTFMPCDDLECRNEQDVCEDDSIACSTALGVFNSGQCEGYNAQDCWRNVAGQAGFTTAKFKAVFQCFEDCKRLGQCKTDADCRNGGSCFTADYGAKFCKCSDDWLGWDCSIRTAFNNVLQVDDETGEVNLYFAWTMTNEHMYFQWKCRGSVWCSVQMGATDDDIMNNAYPIVGTVGANGVVYMADTVSNGEPTDDTDAGGTYDLEEISGWLDGGYEVFRCRTKRDTGDFNDWVYEPNVRSKASWAYGTLPLYWGMDYHGLGNRQLLYLDFSSGVEPAHQISEPPTEKPDDLDVPGYDCEAIFPNAPVKLFWTISGDSIDIAFGGSVPDDYWFGFAFAPGVTMEDGDAVIALANGDVKQYDLLTSPNDAVPEPDFRNEIWNTAREEIDGFTLMKFTRDLETNDELDMIISIDELEAMNVLWSYGSDPIPDGHSNRGVAEVHFGICDGGGIIAESPSPPSEILPVQPGSSLDLIWTAGERYEDITVFPHGFVHFDFYPGAHDVYQFLSEEDYNACDFPTAIMLADTESTPYIFEATEAQAGTTIYIGCSIPEHCPSGQRIAIHVFGDAIDTQVPEETVRPSSPPTLVTVTATVTLFWTYGETYEDIVIFPSESVGFNFTPGLHDVYQFLSEDHYNNCDFTSAILLADIQSSSYIFEATEGHVDLTFYIGCSVPGHCLSGQKVVIRIAPESVPDDTETPIIDPPEDTEAPTVESPSEDCDDIQRWVDKDGDDCIDYQSKGYCTSGGGYGSQWIAEWGFFEDYEDRNGVDAFEACCVCGGGLVNVDEDGESDGDDEDIEDDGQSDIDDGLNYESEILCGDSVAGSTRGRVDYHGDVAGDALFKFTLTESDTVVFDACESSFDTHLYVLDRMFNDVLCECDDCGGCGSKTALQCSLEGPANYILVVGGYNDNEGNYAVRVDCPKQTQACCVGLTVESTCNVLAVKSVCEGRRICSWTC